VGRSGAACLFTYQKQIFSRLSDVENYNEKGDIKWINGLFANFCYFVLASVKLFSLPSSVIVLLSFERGKAALSESFDVEGDGQLLEGDFCAAKGWRSLFRRSRRFWVAEGPLPEIKKI
jgi:hypothetical protein